MVRCSPLEYCWRVCQAVESRAATRISPYPTKSTDIVEVEEWVISRVPEVKHDMQHNSILPSEKGRNPSRKANATSPITT
jgi:hypothetical protein